MNATVYVVDDDAAVRRALAFALEAEGLKVRTFESAGAFIDACDPQLAGCVVLDLRMPGMDGLQAQAALAARGIELPIIFLTGHGDVATSVQAMKSGALDFLQKPVPAKTLLASVTTALLKDEGRRTNGIQRDLARTRLARLTAREGEVLPYIIAGRSAKQIARALGISPRTIEIHRKNILQKTESGNLLALIEFCRIAEEKR